MIEGRKFQLRNVLFCFLLVCYLGKVCKMTRRRNECVVIPLKDKEALLRSLFQINSFCFQEQNELWDVDVLKVFIFNYIVDARIDRRLAGAAGHTQIDVESNLAGEARPPATWRLERCSALEPPAHPSPVTGILPTSQPPSVSPQSSPDLGHITSSCHTLLTHRICWDFFIWKEKYFTWNVEKTWLKCFVIVFLHLFNSVHLFKPLSTILYITERNNFNFFAGRRFQS